MGAGASVPVEAEMSTFKEMQTKFEVSLVLQIQSSCFTKHSS